MQKSKIFKVIVGMNIEYRTIARNIDEAIINIENTELPNGYVENSFKIKGVFPLKKGD